MPAVRRIAPVITLVTLALAAGPAAAQTVDTASATASLNQTYQGRYGLTVTCPNPATLGTPFTCTFTHANGGTAGIPYVIRKAGQRPRPVSQAQAYAALNRVMPLAYWIGVSERAYASQPNFRNFTIACPDTATKPSQRVTCTVAPKGGGKATTLVMRFVRVKPFGYALEPVA